MTAPTRSAPGNRRRRSPGALAAAAVCATVLSATAAACGSASADRPANPIIAGDAELGWWQLRTVSGEGEFSTPLAADEALAPNEVITLPGDALFFAHGSAAIAPDARLLLDQVATALIAADTDVIVVGHTDADDSDAYNVALGQARADAVADQLRQRGVDDQQLVTVISDGERCPVADNDTETGRAANRRVELVPISGSALDLSACPTRPPAPDTVEGR